MRSNGYDKDAEEKNNGRKEKKEKGDVCEARKSRHALPLSQLMGHPRRIVAKEKMRTREKTIMIYDIKQLFHIHIQRMEKMFVLA
jgi:hypothetical protein